MIKLNSYKKQKSRAQTMVEFALALPVLLTLLYGLLETGRLLFIYGSTITAARTAVRYGSATGFAADGFTPLYADCTGIRAAAQKVGFINRFEDADILISYDQGVNNDGTSKPFTSPNPPIPDCGAYPPPTGVNNGDRIIVTVSAQWVPIVPLLPLKPFEITSTSERTLINSIGIYAPTPIGGYGGSGAGKPILYTAVADPTTFISLDQVIQYTFELTNESDVGTLTNPGIVNNKVLFTGCGGITSVAPLDDYTCYGSYTITQADFDNGYVTNYAYPTGYPNNLPIGPVPTTILTTQTAAMSLAKSGNPAATSRVGKVITYTYTLTNQGNVTLRTPFTVTDNLIPVNCSGASDIAPGASTTCIGTAVVTAADIAAHQIVNTATARVQFTYRGDSTATTITSNTATFTVLTPAILLEVSPPPIRTAAGPGTYTYTLTNDTDYDATGVSLTDSLVTITSCPSVVPALSSISCDVDYTFTQADMDAGISIASTSQASGTINSVVEPSNPVTVSVGITQTKTLTATLTATPSTNPLVAGSTILYTYSLTNTGSVTLKSPIGVTDTMGTTITCADQSNFAPAAPARTCTGTHTVTAGDLASLIQTTGTATATFNNGTPETITAAPVTAITPTFSGPRFNLTITNVNPSIVTILPTTVQFTYRFTNTGSVVLYSPYAVTSSLTPQSLDCTLATSSIAVGAYTTCIGSYSVTTSGNKTNTISAATVTTDGVTAVAASNLPQSASVMVQLCNPSTVPLSYGGNGGTTHVWTIQNNSGATVHISTMTIVWGANGNRDLNSVNFSPPSTPVFSGTNGNGNLIFTGPWTIASGTSATITAIFSKGTTVSDLTLTFQESYCTGAWSNP